MQVYRSRLITRCARLSTECKIWSPADFQYHAQPRYYQYGQMAITASDSSVTERPNLSLFLLYRKLVVGGAWFRDTTSFAIRRASGSKAGSNDSNVNEMVTTETYISRMRYSLVELSGEVDGSKWALFFFFKIRGGCRGGKNTTAEKYNHVTLGVY